MKGRCFLPLRGALAALALAGCREPRHGETPQHEPPPVVHVQPVETRPFEDGYAVGIEAVLAEAKPREDLPGEIEIEAKATEAADRALAQQEKWRRGWAEGYRAGFQQKATGRK